ncbi:MAG: ribosome maturation factor RimP [Acidobacteriota bacterium]
MSQEAEIADRVEALLREPLGGLGYQLLDVEYRFEGRWVLRLLIDREQGIGLDDCGTVSEMASRILDVEDPVPTAFSLEVSSPGLFRPLKLPRHFRQSIGKMVRFSLAPDVMASRKDKVLRCRITDVKEETLLVESEGEILELPLDGIRSARLDPDL